MQKHPSYDFADFLEEDVQSYRKILESLPFDPELNRFFVEQKAYCRQQDSLYHRHRVHADPEGYLGRTLLAPSAEHAFFFREQSRRLEAALDALPARTRNRVIRYVIDGSSYQELAREECVSISAVEQSVRRGLRKLRERITGRSSEGSRFWESGS